MQISEKFQCVIQDPPCYTITNSQVLDVEVDRLSQQVQQRTALERTVILLFLTMKSLFLTVTVFVKKAQGLYNHEKRHDNLLRVSRGIVFVTRR